MRLTKNNPLLNDVFNLLKDCTKYSALAFLVFVVFCAALKIFAVVMGYYPPKVDGPLTVEPHWLLQAPLIGYFAIFLLTYVAIGLKVNLDKRVVSTAVLSSSLYSLMFVVLLAVLKYFELSYLLPSDMGLILYFEQKSYVTALIHGIVSAVIVALIYRLSKRPAVSTGEGLRLGFCIWFMALVSLLIYFVTHNCL